MFSQRSPIQSFVYFAELLPLKKKWLIRLHIRFCFTFTYPNLHIYSVSQACACTPTPLHSGRGVSPFPEVAGNFLPEVLAKILMCVFAVASWTACPGARQFTNVKHRPLMCWVEERNWNVEHWVTAAEFYVESMTQNKKKAAENLKEEGRADF